MSYALPPRPRFGLFLLVRRSLRQHALSTSITALSLALASGLVSALFVLSAQSERAFTADATRFDGVLGARGSELQLVLNAIFHLETSPGNLPWETYEAIRAEPAVRHALPLAVGDNWRGWRIAGTTAEMFDAEALGDSALRVAGEGEWGRVFDEQAREAVIGSWVAKRTGLTVGSHFQPTHGIHERGHEHDDEYVVVGVLEPTSSPSDRVIWIPIEGVFRMEGHVLRGTGELYEPQPGEDIPDEHKELSAVLLKLRSPTDAFALQNVYGRGDSGATLAAPVARAIADLFAKLGWMTRALEMVAYLTVVVGAASVLASLYNTMNERRREFAILRALGARRRTLFAAIVLESATIAALGGALGLLVHVAITIPTARLLRDTTGVVIDPLAWHPALLLAPLAVTLIGAAAGLIPALRAYRTEVARNLLPSS